MQCGAGTAKGYDKRTSVLQQLLHHRWSHRQTIALFNSIPLLDFPERAVVAEGQRAPLQVLLTDTAKASVVSRCGLIQDAISQLIGVKKIIGHRSFAATSLSRRPLLRHSFQLQSPPTAGSIDPHLAAARAQTPTRVNRAGSAWRDSGRHGSRHRSNSRNNTLQAIIHIHLGSVIQSGRNELSHE